MATTSKKRAPRAKGKPAAPDKSTTTPTAKASTSTAVEAGAKAEGRLGKGQLQDLVLEHQRAHRGEDLTPTQVGKALGRSSGAVGNALHKSARDDESPVVQTSTKPRRYSIPRANGHSRTNRLWAADTIDPVSRNTC